MSLSGGILLAEFVVTMGLERLPWASGGNRALVASLLLTALIFPLLYLLWGRPAARQRDRLEHELEERKLAEIQLAEDQTRLASLIAERTHELEIERKKLEALLERLPEGVLFVDEERRVLLANRVARSYLPLLVGRVVDHEFSRVEGVNAEELLPQEASMRRIEIAVDGPPRVVLEVAAARLEGQVGAAVSVLLVREVTAEREAERQLRQQERLAAVGELAAGVAHDFNNILQSVLLFSDLILKQGGLSASQTGHVQAVIKQGERGASLIRQILDFSRRSVHRKQPVDLLPFLRGEVQLLAQTIPENVRIALRAEPGEYWTVADHAQLQQVVANLAINARDALPAGGDLRFHLERVAGESEQPVPLPEMPPGRYLKLSVKDTGRGIPESVRSHIFDPFFTTKQPGEGTGLGLSQVYGIVKEHGGHIDVTSTEGEGTLFQIFLPEAAGAARSEPESVLPAARTGEGQTILVVEDNAEILRTAEECLITLGYKVRTALDGEEALDIFRRHRDGIALVLSDMVMPKLGGLDLATALRTAAPGVPVVLISGYPLGGIEDQLLRQGVSAWVQKPFSADQLARAVGGVLSVLADGPQGGSAQYC